MNSGLQDNTDGYEWFEYIFDCKRVGTRLVVEKFKSERLRVSVLVAYA